MNVYDFDGTIYNGDSSVDFWLFCLRRNPALIRCALRFAHTAIRSVFQPISKEELKTAFFSFLNGLDKSTVDVLLADFWANGRQRIRNFYLQRRNPLDIVISASPEFLLRPVCAELGISGLIASVVDKRTGTWISANCCGHEKVRRFRELFPDGKVAEFYSDSRSDAPMAMLADTAYFVRGNSLRLW
jgi:HAD superfamily phosphoserine phosphatase-like hydrolase